MTVAELSDRFTLAWGRTRVFAALAAGGIAALSMAPTGTYAWPAIFIAFPMLVWLIDGAGAGGGRGIAAAAGIGWWFGFGYFLAGLWWVGAAFLVDADKFAWLLPVAVAGLPAGLALFTAAGTALARALWCRGPARVVALAVGLTAAEWLRGHLLTGLPWNSFGYALAADIRLAQGAALGGLWSLTFLAIAVGALPALLADSPRETARPWRWVGLGALILAALALYGGVRLARTEVGTATGVRLRLMQPNLPQDQKFRYAAKDAVMAHYLQLSDLSKRAPGTPPITHLIWPESAFPFFLHREPDALAQIADLLKSGAYLITGAARLEQHAEGQGLRNDVFNSVQIVDPAGSIVATYDKVHLVPFGEYLPFQAALEAIGLEQLTRVRGGFAAGTRHRALAVPGAPPAAALICFEIVFPGEAVPEGAPRPGWILNLTNDGWFGMTSGPYQHFAQARLRAIEEGLPVVRVANTGISAVIDPLGRITAALPLGSAGVIDAELPLPLEPNIYAYSSDRIIVLVWFSALLLVVFVGRRRQFAAPQDLPKLD